MIETVYIYVDGYDLAEISDQLIHRIEKFSMPYGGLIRMVNQRGDSTSTTEDLPSWDLGINFEIDALTDDEKKRTLLFFQALSAEFQRDFILGGALPNRQDDDFFEITSTSSIEEPMKFLESR